MAFACKDSIYTFQSDWFAVVVDQIASLRLYTDITAISSVACRTFLWPTLVRNIIYTIMMPSARCIRRAAIKTTHNIRSILCMSHMRMGWWTIPIVSGFECDATRPDDDRFAMYRAFDESGHVSIIYRHLSDGCLKCRTTTTTTFTLWLPTKATMIFFSCY